MTEVYLGLGSNLGDREANLRRALELLTAYGVKVQQLSPIYETEPVDAPDSGPFLNAVCQAETPLDPQALLRTAKAIEEALGRSSGPRNAPRAIDIDILLYGDLVLDTPELTIPHPRMADRAFVLAPLADIAVGIMHPVLGKTVQEMLNQAPGRCGVKPCTPEG